MRIAILSTALPVPPGNYGGTEWVVYYLADGLAKRGHDVTLFAGPNSKVGFRVKIVSIKISFEFDDYLVKLWEEEREFGKFDVIHDHSNDGFINSQRWETLPYLSTIHGQSHFKQKNRVYISKRQCELNKEPEGIVVYHGLNGKEILFNDKKKNYLFWIGRLDWQKVPHLAIEVAKRTNLPLILAGPNCDGPYVEKYIKPQLSEKIRWIGAISRPHKDLIYADAKATLFPCGWREPFGLTVIESMFAGTPVIVQDNEQNAMNEIIEDGVSGYICKDVDQMVEAVSKLDKLEPRLIRQCADRKFSQERMVQDYLQLYNKVKARGTW